MPYVVKLCSCGSEKESRWISDARGIPLTRVCDDCETVKKKSYRIEVLNDSNYEADEPIEPEE